MPDFEIIPYADLGDFVLLGMYFLGDDIALNVYNNQSYQAVFNMEGMPIAHTPMPTLKTMDTGLSLYTPQKCEVLDQNEETRSLIIMSQTDYWEEPNVVYKLNLVRKPIKQYVITTKFQGIFGLNRDGFQCGGFCIDKNRRIS